MRSNRRTSGHLSKVRLDYYKHHTLSFNNACSKEDELWLILRGFSEIKSERNRLVKPRARNKRELEHAANSFSSYIKQAHNYYMAAKNLPVDSSPLLYYYSFLNLMKAYLAVQRPSEVDSRNSHGLSVPNRLDRKIRTINVRALDTPSSIFSAVYSDYTGEKLAHRTSFNILRLLAYCADIGYEYELSKFGKSESCRGSVALVVNTANDTVWPIVAIAGSHETVFKHKKRVSKFLKLYEKVDFEQRLARDIFGISAIERSAYVFYERKEALSPDNVSNRMLLLNELERSLQFVYLANYRDDERHSFMLQSPYRLNKQLLMNEQLAIYSIMFYLSDLVRYKPHTLDKLLSGKEKWLFESFVKSAPPTFLSRALSMITETGYSLKME